MHDNLLMLNREIFFEQNLTLSFISAVQVRFLFWAIYFLLKKLRRETIWTLRFRFFVVKLLLNWTFFVFSIHNVRPSNLFCCLSLFKASRVWKILMTFSKQQQQVSFFLNLFSQACQTSTIGSHLSQTAFPDNQFWLRTPVMRFPGNSNKIHNFST